MGLSPRRWVDVERVENIELSDEQIVGRRHGWRVARMLVRQVFWTGEFLNVVEAHQLHLHGLDRVELQADVMRQFVVLPEVRVKRPVRMA